MTDQDLTQTAAEMQRTLAEVAEYFGLDKVREGASLATYRAQAKEIRECLTRPTNLVERLGKSAQYVASIEDRWDQARQEERTSKAAFMAALVNAIEPALPAISGPLVRRRTFAGKDEQRELFEDRRGIVLLDGWRRDICNGDAGKSLALLEDSSLVILRHLAVDRRSDYQVGTRLEHVSIEDSLTAFNRKGFLDAVHKIVTSVWDLARSKKRKEQITESHQLADKLAALRVLLQGSGS